MLMHWRVKFLDTGIHRRNLSRPADFANVTTTDCFATTSARRHQLLPRVSQGVDVGKALVIAGAAPGFSPSLLVQKTICWNHASRDPNRARVICGVQSNPKTFEGKLRSKSLPIWRRDPPAGSFHPAGGRDTRPLPAHAISTGWEKEGAMESRQVDIISPGWFQQQMFALSGGLRAYGSEKVMGMACVGFLWSCSTMMVTSLLPVFMRAELGASHLSIGVLEGTATLLNTVAKAGAGVLSDILRSRARVIAAGSVLTALVKVVFAGATSVYGVFVARSLDRVAKGIRMAPTDALLADLSSEQQRGRTYALYYTMMTLGAGCGAVLASGCMLATRDNFRLTFALATVPALLATLLLEIVTDTNTNKPPRSVWPRVADSVGNTCKTESSTSEWTDWNSTSIHVQREERRTVLTLITQAAHMPRRFWSSLFVFTVLMMARFSEAFVFLQARSVGVPIAVIPMFAIANNLIQASMAYPMGCLSDHCNRKTILLSGFLVLAASDFILIGAKSPGGIMVGFMLTGVHMAMTHGNMKALMSESIPDNLRGTGFAVMAIASGLSLASGNLLAGILSDFMGPHGAFVGGLISVLLATLLGMFML